MSILRRLAVAATDAVARKLRDAGPDNPGSALALRSDARLAPSDRSDFLPTARPSQTLYAPPRYAPPVVHAQPPAPPRRRIVIVEETTWRS